MEQQSHQRYVNQNGRYQRRDNTGPAIAGGILGVILGTFIAGNTSDRDYYNHNRNDRGWRPVASRPTPASTTAMRLRRPGRLPALLHPLDGGAAQGVRVIL